MQELKSQLKALANEDLPQLFRRLQELLAAAPSELNEIIQLQSRFNINESERHGGRISLDDYQLEFNKILNAVLFRIDSLKLEVLGEKPDDDDRPALHDYHCHTCDRVDQSDRFQKIFGEKRELKVHFFYLYGMDVQSHEGMFRRIAFDLEGKLRDYLNPGLDSGCKSLQIDKITLGMCGDPEVYKQNILKDLFTAFGIRVNEQEPLTSKNIAWLLENSPLLHGLCQDDYVCIFAGISQWDWDKDMTPDITRWFIHDFCSAELPNDSPTFLFFFAIIYEEDDAEIEAEVEAVIGQSSHVNALPELDMVKMRDIGAWFSRYKFIAASSAELKELRQKHFDAPEFEMETVELNLKKLIDDYNRKFF